MARFSFTLFTLLLLLCTLALFGQPAPAADITVEVGTATVTPAVNPPKPIARVGEDDFLTIQIVQDGKVPRQDRTLLRFNQEILELDTSGGGGTTLVASTTRTGNYAYTLPGASHHIRFRRCSEKYFRDWEWKGRKITKDDCPLLVASASRGLTVYANSDAIAMDAWLDEKRDGANEEDFSPKNTRVTPFTIRTVRPYWGLQFSTGFSFFGGNDVRDEQYTFAPIVDNPATPNVDEGATTDRAIVFTGHGETPYELGAFATYMIRRPKVLPLGLTFGVSTKVPVDELTAVGGISTRIAPFPLTDSAFLTIGVAYRGHKQLAGKYRDTLRAPAGVTEADLVESRHDFGLFAAVSFGFGGGDTQFKRVVSGQ